VEQLPRTLGSELTRGEKACAPLLLRRRIVPPTRQCAGRVAGAKEHQKARAAPQHCGCLLPLPTTHLLSSRREGEGHEGKERKPVPRPSWRRRRCPPPPPRVGGGGGTVAAVRCLVALRVTEGLHLHVRSLFAAWRRARRTSMTSLFSLAAPATRKRPRGGGRAARRRRRRGQEAIIFGVTGLPSVLRQLLPHPRVVVLATGPGEMNCLFVLVKFDLSVSVFESRFR
jgi:hypothetical protein